jgi:hypothetical protein
LPIKSAKLLKPKSEGQVEGGDEGGGEVAALETGPYKRIPAIYRLLLMEFITGNIFVLHRNLMNAVAILLPAVIFFWLSNVSGAYLNVRFSGL